MQNLQESSHKGILEIKFPDNKNVSMNDVFPKSDSIFIKSKKLSSLKLKTIFINNVTNAIKNIDTSKISPEFLNGSCSSDFCDIPTLRLSASNDDIIFLKPYDFQKHLIISIVPKVSTCYSLIKYCKFRDEKQGCMGCTDPYMILVKNITNAMATNIK